MRIKAHHQEFVAHTDSLFFHVLAGCVQYEMKDEIASLLQTRNIMGTEAGKETHNSFQTKTNNIQEIKIEAQL